MANIDQTQDFTAAWNVDQNDTGYPDGSLEAHFWPHYREIMTGVMLHAASGDAESVRWHCRALRILLTEIQGILIELSK
jgi:hypothetical protein